MQCTWTVLTSWRDYQEIDCPYLIYGIPEADVDVRWPSPDQCHIAFGDVS